MQTYRRFNNKTAKLFYQGFRSHLSRLQLFEGNSKVETAAWPSVDTDLTTLHQIYKIIRTHLTETAILGLEGG